MAPDHGAVNRNITQVVVFFCQSTRFESPVHEPALAKPTRQSQNQEQRAAVRSAPLEDRNVARLDAHLQHAVQPGETLSGIALQYLRDGVTMNQMMIALFQANMQAFDDNISVLHAGAILRLPDENDLRRQTPETATTEVARQTKAWQADYE
jgi:pilus assembly protein FimV